SGRMQSTEQLSTILLDQAAETTVVNGACAALYDLFVSAATATADAARSPTPSRRLTAGLALSPALAAKFSTPEQGRSRHSPFC
ncbi:MAG TPA: hypothetical protein VLQ45_14900, partial [Thermoanaerobaculia bacterium]|nr:hypothetical protein [Thermoanaerobaculia bacterium]